MWRLLPRSRMTARNLQDVAKKAGLAVDSRKGSGYLVRRIGLHPCLYYP